MFVPRFHDRRAAGMKPQYNVQNIIGSPNDNSI